MLENHNIPPNSESPPNSKSHFFVQKYDLEDGYRVCRICNEKFKPNRPKQIYCSKECYKIAVKTNQKIWYKKNRERLIDKQVKYNRDRRAPPKPRFNERSFHLLNRLEYRKCTIIKRELIKKELLSCQLLTYSAKRKNKNKLNFYTDRRKFDGDKVEFIKKKLAEYDLPEGYTYPVEFPEDPKIDVWEPGTYVGKKYFL